MTSSKKQTGTVFSVLVLISISHMLNDTLQSVVSATYPIIRNSLLLNLAQIGIITMVFQLASSVFQPLIGFVTDKYPQPYSLPIGMASTMGGLILLAYAASYPAVLIAVVFIGLGSSIFHPEASRLAHMAAGRRFGLAQSIFQVGGNFGTSIGILVAMWVVAPYGQKNIVWLAFIALAAIIVMLFVSRWYKNNLHLVARPIADTKTDNETEKKSHLPQKTIIKALTILLLLIFSKYVYMASLTNYYHFYLIEKFGLDVKQSLLYLFIFLFSVAVGTVAGGPIGDIIGRKYVIWFSILGAAPFALAMPYMGLMGTCILSVLVGLILSSAFSAILVYAQELMPGRVGLIGGLFFGFMFGVAGIAAAVLGDLADAYGLEYVYKMCAFFPLMGLIAAFLPNTNPRGNEA